MGFETFDRRIAVLVDPREIRPGEDWLRDCGRLRLAASVEAFVGPLAEGILVRFTDDQGGPYATLSIPDGITVTVWRALAEAAGANRV